MVKLHGSKIFSGFLQAIEAARAELIAQLKNFNELILTRTYLVGERLSLADITVALDLLPAYQVKNLLAKANGILKC